jgi:putative restriction endonuclease
VAAIIERINIGYASHLMRVPISLTATFGHIDGTTAGEIFEDRKHLRTSGIHALTMAGIWDAQEGAYSVVLSGGYEDDIDELDYTFYTGQDGQDAPDGKQVVDQKFIKGNLDLRLSCDYGLPAWALSE